MPRVFWLGIVLGVASAAQAQLRFESIDVGRGGVAIGYQQYARVIEGPDGTLYGQTRFGGTTGGGTLFKVGKDGGGFRILHYFGPDPDGKWPTYGGLTVGTNGLLYGVTWQGGSNGVGTVFRLRTDGDDYRILYHCRSAGGSANPRCRLVLGDDDALYGATQSGLIFKIDHDGENLQPLHEAGNDPAARGSVYQIGVIRGSDGWLYGTSESGGLTNSVREVGDPWPTMGTLYRVRQDGTGYEILHQFQGTTVGDGYGPRAALYEASDGRLYGTTPNGGIYSTPGVSSDGTVYRLQRDGTGYEVIHRFRGADGYSPGDVVEGPDGAIYGLAGSGVFRMSKDGSEFSVLAHFEGNAFSGPTWASDGKLYGAVFEGVFSIEADGSGLQWLFRFGTPSPPESAPRAPLLRASSGSLVGTTEAGATGSNGSVFLRSTATGPIQVTAQLGLVSSPGRLANGMAEGTNGFFYGTTQAGGSNNAGVIFRTQSDGRALTNLYHFAATGDGRAPRAALVSGRDGFLYGAGYQGGAFGRGTIFKIREDGSGYVTLYHLGTASPDGQAVQAALVLGPDGLLYGVANGGGSGGRGTVFRLNRDGTGYANLRHFSAGSDGANPQSPLLLGSDGYFYGSTIGGGNGFGTIYRLKPDGSDYRVLYRPASALQGNSLRGPMVEKPRGVLWGCALRGGISNAGVVFRATMDGGDYRVAWNFAGGVAGTAPFGGLTLDSAGWLAGTTAEGGVLGFGTIFRFDPEAVYLQHEIAGGNLIVRWARGSGMDDVETATEWSDGWPVWQPRAADVELDGEMNRAVFPLQAVRQVLIRVRRDPE